MAAIFGHFLKSWEGKGRKVLFSNWRHTLSKHSLFVSSYLFSNATKFGDWRREQRGEETSPKPDGVCLKMSDAPRTISKRKGIYYCQQSSGKVMHRHTLILETNAVFTWGGRRPTASWWTRRTCGWAQQGLTPAGMGETDSCMWRISCGLGWWQETCSHCCVYCCERGVVNNWQVACIFALENNPWVTISIKQFGSKLFF